MLAFLVGAGLFTLTTTARSAGSQWLPGTILAEASAMLCDTQRQIETLLSRVLNGVPGPQALTEINREALKMNACGHAPRVNLKIVRVVRTKAFQKKNGLFYHFDILEVQVIDFGGVVQFLAAHDPSVHPYYEVQYR